MGCNCGKPKPKPGSGQGGKFSLETKGITQTFGSQLERDAAWVNGGRTGTRRG